MVPPPGVADPADLHHPLLLPVRQLIQMAIVGLQLLHFSQATLCTDHFFPDLDCPVAAGPKLFRANKSMSHCGGASQQQGCSHTSADCFAYSSHGVFLHSQIREVQHGVGRASRTDEVPHSCAQRQVVLLPLRLRRPRRRTRYSSPMK